MSLTSVFAPITKTAEQDDGSLLVYGKASDDALDLDGQRCDMAWLDEAIPEWFKIGNVRAQHRSDSAVGKAIEHEKATDGHYVTARIVDREAIAKTRAGVFTGFSIGIRSPKIKKSEDAPNGRIYGGQVVELSLADRPSNPGCSLTLCKAAKPGMSAKSGDFDSKRLLIRCEEFVDVGKLPKPAPEIAIKLDGQDLEKVTDTGNLDAPAPGQTCADCGEDGHLNCGPTKGFDRAAAEALVTETLEKASDGLGQDETDDISGAEQAIAVIAQLIVAEAQAMVDMPSEDCDIHLLMRAVDAMRCFSNREKLEAGAIDPGSVMFLAADTELDKAKYSAEQKQQMLKDGKAFKNPDGDPSYPIADKEDLSNAIHAVGRGSGDHNAIRSYIKKRASALGASDMIPDNWTSSGSNSGSGKTAKPEMEKTVPVETAVKPSDEDVEKNVEKTYTLDEARAELGLPAEEADVVKVSEADVEKDADGGESGNVTESDTTKVVEDDDALTKAFSATVEKLEKSMASVVATTETTAKSVSSLTERLVKVESMATPGGPSLRRTEIERSQSRKRDLDLEVMRFKALASNAEDPDLRKGYAAKAMQLSAEAKALDVA